MTHSLWLRKSFAFTARSCNFSSVQEKSFFFRFPPRCHFFLRAFLCKNYWIMITSYTKRKAEEESDQRQEECRGMETLFKKYYLHCNKKLKFKINRNFKIFLKGKFVSAQLSWLSPICPNLSQISLMFLNPKFPPLSLIKHETAF